MFGGEGEIKRENLKWGKILISGAKQPFLEHWEILESLLPLVAGGVLSTLLSPAVKLLVLDKNV